MSPADRWALLLREARTALGWTYTDLSARTGVDRSNLCRMENGDLVGSLATIVTVADALQIDLNDLKPVSKLVSNGRAP